MKPQFETMYCHNQECERFNEPHNVAFAPTTWHEPGHWLDDPECPVCVSDLEQKPLDEEG